MAEERTILVAVDGSDNAERAVNFAIGFVRSGHASKLHLLNVQPTLSGGIRTFVSRSQIEDYQRTEGEKGVASARKLCEDARIAFEPHISVGRAGVVVSEFARRLGCSQIVIGTRGHTGFSGILLGSVAQEVVAHATVPVTLVK